MLILGNKKSASDGVTEKSKNKTNRAPRIWLLHPPPAGLNENA
jgi:hypothetical protein